MIFRSDCHLWQGPRGGTDGQYGIQYCPERKRTTYAHILAWEAASGRRTEPGEVVRHTCDTPICVNPTHLLVGTQADNVQDMRDRGRSHDQRGTRSHHAKLTKEQVIEIRERLARGERGMDLASAFGVSAGRISEIKHQRTYADV